MARLRIVNARYLGRDDDNRLASVAITTHLMIAVVALSSPSGEFAMVLAKLQAQLGSGSFGGC